MSYKITRGIREGHFREFGVFFRRFEGGFGGLGGLRGA